MDATKIGRFIGAERRAKGWTQRQLADKLQLTDKAISRWETGKGLPDVSLLLPLANVLDITVGELLAGERRLQPPAEVLELLNQLNKIKPVFVELGLQTIHEETASFIRRGYPLSCFDEAVMNLHKIGVLTVVHLILGLPGETDDMMLESVRYLNHLPIHGVKFSMLHILKNTDLADHYEEHPFDVFTLESYVDLILKCIENLSPEIVIHRLTGDGPRDLLIAPEWSVYKRKVLNRIAHEMKVKDGWQGDLL